MGSGCVGGAVSVRVSVKALNVVIRCFSSSLCRANSFLCWRYILSYFGGFVGDSCSGCGRRGDNVEDEMRFFGEECLGTREMRVLMRDDPSASRNGTVWVSSSETTVVGRDTSSNGNFEIRSRIVVLDIVMTFFIVGGMLGKICGGGVVKRWCSI